MTTIRAALKQLNENQAKITVENSRKLPISRKVGVLTSATNKVVSLKRKAATYIFNEDTQSKRSVFGDITNACNKANKTNNEKNKQIECDKTLKKSIRSGNKENGSTKYTVNPINIETKARNNRKSDAVTSSHEYSLLSLPSFEGFKSDFEESSYVTASEGSPADESPLRIPEEALIDGEIDFDECQDDPCAVSLYVKDIFVYYKQRENNFVIEKYMSKQPEVNHNMRAILVDWMVDVQESFELNHETLYLAVKLVDLYLSKVVITRDVLQLIGSTALFIACKYDEIASPYIDDFLYICDDAYTRKELILMEIKMLNTFDFDLGVPLSYRYLRRYARCGKLSMEDITLARYILELSLMEYDLVDSSDALLAAAALALTNIINKHPPWSSVFQYYSGFKLEDLYHLIHLLHSMLQQPPKEHQKTIRTKYSSKTFFEVAKIPIPEDLGI